MACECSESELLAFFRCHCRGIKFYDLASVGAAVWGRLKLVRDPSNLHDASCVEVYLVGAGRHKKLGHVAREAAEWLSPMLLGPFTIFGIIMSEPYSMDPGGSRCWRYRVLDMHIFLTGASKYMEPVAEALEGSGLEDLQFGIDDERHKYDITTQHDDGNKDTLDNNKDQDVDTLDCSNDALDYNKDGLDQDVDAALDRNKDALDKLFDFYSEVPTTTTSNITTDGNNPGTTICDEHPGAYDDLIEQLFDFDSGNVTDTNSNVQNQQVDEKLHMDIITYDTSDDLLDELFN